MCVFPARPRCSPSSNRPDEHRRRSHRKIHGHHDFLGVGALSAAEEADLIAAEQAPQHETSFIILSDLHLDNAKVLAALRDVLGVYNDMDEKSIPRLFVLCGNFRSRPWLFDGEAMREYTGACLDDARGHEQGSAPLRRSHRAVGEICRD